MRTHPTEMRINLGCGSAYMEGWVNVDSSPDVFADVHLDAVDFIRRYGHECDELYMGHFIEHLTREDASALLRLILARLPAGARVSAVCPDIRAVLDAYARGDLDNRTLNEMYIYSYVQPSHHRWSYDPESLVALLEETGFGDVQAIDPLTWPPVYWKSGPDSLYQCGAVGTVVNRPGNGAQEAVGKPTAIALDAHPSQVAPRATVGQSATLTVEEELLERAARYRARLDRVEATARELKLQHELLVSQTSILQGRLDAINSSRSVRLATRATTLAIPPGSRRRTFADILARRLPGLARPHHDE